MTVRNRIVVHLGTPVTVETIERQAPDVVVIVTGPRPALPGLPISGGAQVVEARAILTEEVPVHASQRALAGFDLEQEEQPMADLVMLDRAYHHVMQRIVHTGQAPHYTELATDLGLAMEAGKLLLYELIDSGIPAWLHPVGSKYSCGLAVIVVEQPTEPLSTLDR